MNNSHRFFNNRDCEYFPCHQTSRPDEFNCLFCYCPLYTLADCGGKHTWMKGIKVCSDCTVPHVPKGYEYINQKLKERNEKIRIVND